MYNQSMRLALLILLCVLPHLASAAEALSGDTIRLDDNRILRLQGIKAAGDSARDTLQSLIAGKKLGMEGATPDRYGRIAADVYALTDKGEKIWLQAELLGRGLAFIYPPTGGEPHLADLFQAEKDARAAHKSIWGDAGYADLPADKPNAIRYGRFAFVSGKVVKAERVKNKFYLNFGDDWKKDFTVSIAAHDLHVFRKAGIEPESYAGKTVRVRGWVIRDFGPMMTVTHPAQIEVLGEPPPIP